MNWQDLFDKKLLDSGRQYLRQGRVSIISENENSIRAKVRGSERLNFYQVDIDFSEDDIAMKCNCKSASFGNYCKHMAAALFEDEMFGNFKHFENKGEQLVDNPFVTPDGEVYTYFNLSDITSDMVFSEAVVRKGKVIFNNENISIDDIEVGFGKYSLDNEQNCNLIGIYSSESGNYDIKLCFDRINISTMECKAPGCKCMYNRFNPYFEDRNHPCEHVTALLFEFEDYQKYHIVGDATDRSGMQAIEFFRRHWMNKQIHLDENRELMQQITLEPRLILEKGALMLSFRIGENKLYAVKSLKELAEDYYHGSIYSVGKTASINFATASFTSKSQKYMNYISQEVMEDASLDNGISLYGRKLDDFFDRVESSSVLFINKDSSDKDKYISFSLASPKVSLTISEEVENGQLSNIRVHGMVPDVFDGIRYKYFFEDNSFCRIIEDDANKYKAIWDLSKDGIIDFAVGRKYIPEFYHRILPVLGNAADIDNQVSSTVENLLPDDVEIVFYLDAEDKYLLCNPLAIYGERRLSVIDFLDSDMITESFRDQFKENEVLDLVLAYFPNIDDTTKQFYCDRDDDSVFRVLEKGLPALMEVGRVHCTDAFKSKNTKRSVKVSVGVSVVSDLMNLEIYSDGISPRQLLDILYSYKLKKKYHRLSNGDFVELTDDSLGELNAMIDAMNISPKDFAKGRMQLPIYRALYLDKMLESCEEIYASRDKHFKSLVKDYKTIKDSEYEVPATFKNVLRNYQQYGYKWIKSLSANNFAGILADDMGLGKTLQMISVIAGDKELAQNPSLIVCPASLIYNWQAEFEKFAPELKVLVIVGSMQERKALIEACDDYDVLITSYDLLKRDVAEYENIKFHYQVIDEAQYIKTYTTAAAKSVKAIKASHKMALTGTPIENKLSELWSIFDYLMPGFLYSYEHFKREIENPIVRAKDEEVTYRLRRMVSPFILRRLKKDVLKDLPDKIEEHRYAKMDEEQKQLYDAQVMHMRSMLESQDEKTFQRNRIQILSELMRIRQICCDPRLFVEDYKGESAKRTACMDLIQSAIEGEHKILVFSQFTSMLDLLAEDLTKAGISYYVITGATSKEKRISLVHHFNNNDVPVFLISLKAGGTGLNLTGADVVIHYDPWWNVAAQNQATDRAHRIGQSKIVTVYKLIVKGSIEDKIVEMQKEKENLANEILTGETSTISSMTRDEILNLFD